MVMQGCRGRRCNNVGIQSVPFAVSSITTDLVATDFGARPFINLREHPLWQTHFTLGILLEDRIHCLCLVAACAPRLPATSI
jgi:hypothetical protein